MTTAKWIAAPFLVAVLAAFAPQAASAADDNEPEFLEALVPVEVLPPDPATANGEVRGFGMRFNPIVIASQPARVARAIVADESGGNVPKNALLNFTVLGPLKFDPSGALVIDDAGSQTAWCDNSVRPDATIRCFQDRNSDGKLDAIRPGLLPTKEALAVNRVGAAIPVPPFAYREASEDERPRMLLQYITCPADEGTYRYALAIRRIQANGRNGEQTLGACDAVGTAITDGNTANLYAFGRFKVALSGTGGKRTATLVEGIPAGTVLGHVRADRPLTDARETRSFRENLAEMSGTLPFLYFVRSAQVTAGPIAPGDPILAGEVAHGLTGKLATPVVRLGVFGRKEELPAGTRVFGNVMSSRSADEKLDPDIIWCTPHPDPAKSFARCMAPTDFGDRLVTSEQRFALERLSVSSNDPAIQPPIVERQALDFGEPLYTVVRFDKWDGDVAVVSVKVDFDSRNDDFHELRLRRTDAGAAYLAIGEALVALRPAAEDASRAIAEQAVPIRSGSNAMPFDAYSVGRQIEARR